MVKNPPAKARDVGDLRSTPGSGKSPGEGNGSPLQYSCLEHSMDRGAWQAIVHGVARVGYSLVTEPPPPPGYTEADFSSCQCPFPLSSRFSR